MLSEEAKVKQEFTSEMEEQKNQKENIQEEDSANPEQVEQASNPEETSSESPTEDSKKEPAVEHKEETATELISGESESKDSSAKEHQEVEKSPLEEAKEEAPSETESEGSVDKSEIAPPAEEEKPKDEIAEAEPEEAAVEGIKEQSSAEEKPSEPVKTEAEVDTSSPVEKPADSVEKKEKTPKEEEKEEKTVNPAFEELKAAKENNDIIEVEIKARIRGGIRAMYKDIPVFLPSSHFNLRRNPKEEELTSSINTNVKVQVHEAQQDEKGRTTVIVSRKSLIEQEFWSNIKEGDIVEGTVSSIANFGIFLDIGGFEGLIHISRLSQIHVDNTKKFAKKGDTMKAIVVECDREKKRIALSRKELEKSPWEGVAEEFQEGTICKGIVRRLTDFGAYVELKPGVDGLLRTVEISWKKRVKSPSDVLKPDQEIDVYIMSVSEEKQTVGLSLKRATENPWEGLEEKYPVNSQSKGTVLQVNQKGAVISVNDEVDAFMPRSKMNLARGKKIPFAEGDQVDVFIADVVPAQESMILSLGNPEEQKNDSPRQAPAKQAVNKYKDPDNSGSSFSFGDLLSDISKKKLIDKDSE